MLVGCSLRSKVIGQEDHGLNFGATGSIAYTSRSARFCSLLGMWVVYIMFTVRTCGGKPFCPLLFGGRGSSSSSLCSPLSLFSVFNLPACLNTQKSLWCGWLAFRGCHVSGTSDRVFVPNWTGLLRICFLSTSQRV